MEDKKSRDTREAIRLAAIDLLEREGGTNITTRAIAAAAGVNVAAINYYFRSKDALLEEALRSTWTHSLEHFHEYLGGDPWDLRKGIDALAGFFLEGGTRFPNLVRAHIFGLRFSRKNQEPRHSVTGAGLFRLVRETAEKVASSLGIETSEELILRTGAFFAAIVHTVLLPDTFPSLKEEGRLDLYRKVLVDDYLAAVLRMR